jgi:hypothetical protein
MIWPAAINSPAAGLILNPDLVQPGQFAASVAGVERAGRFDQEDAAFIFSNRFMLDAFRHDVHFTFVEADDVIAQVDLHRSSDEDEDFVGFGVGMPDELALDLGQLEMVIVHLGDDARRPEVAELGELVGEVDRGGRHRKLHGFGFRLQNIILRNEGSMM